MLVFMTCHCFCKHMLMLKKVLQVVYLLHRIRIFCLQLISNCNMLYVKPVSPLFHIRTVEKKNENLLHLVLLKSQDPPLLPPSASVRKWERQTKEGNKGNLRWKANRNYESYPLSSSPIAPSEPVHRDEAVCLSLSGPHQWACATLIHVRRSVNPPLPPSSQPIIINPHTHWHTTVTLNGR